MFKKTVVFLGAFLFCITIIVIYAEEESFKRNVSEKLICQIDLSSVDRNTLIVSPDARRVACVAYVDKQRSKAFIIVDGKEERKYDESGRPVFSPDSKHVAYVAKLGDKQFVVIDGKEEEEKYDIYGNFIFSPDSKHFAYLAHFEGKWFVVVDGKEGEEYDEVLGFGSIIFDSPTSFHYLTRKGNSIYLVEESIEEEKIE